MKNIFIKSLICLDLNISSKEDLIDFAADLFEAEGYLNDKYLFKLSLLEREMESGTGLESGIAMPHAKGSFIKKYGIALIRLEGSGIDFSAVDGEPSRLFFILALPNSVEANEHIETISYLSNLFTNEAYYSTLMNSNDLDEIVNLLSPNTSKVRNDYSLSSNKELILAITACPTGIAHTYMAASALEQAARKLNVEIKVETHGSTGVKNKIENWEIERAKTIIIAADKFVDKSKFKGKNLIEVPVKDGITRADDLIRESLNFKNNKNLYQSEAFNLYKHLMNGVSYMLPFVVSGGILIAISFMFGINSFDPKDENYNIISKILNYIGSSNAFLLMIPVFSGFVAMSIADRPGLAPGMISGLMMSLSNAGFLGGILSGLFSGYITIFVKKIADNLIPSKLKGINPVLIYPFFSVLISGFLTYFLLSPLSNLNKILEIFLNSLSNSNFALLGAILGAMMALDMGGPINKAAFAFGIAMIANKNYIPHSSVMAGGMIPPLGLAISTTIFKNYFNQEEREAGKVCYFLGACFITEAVLPFVASDPIRVIISCVIGSALGGALSAFFGIELMAPHGGIFVIPIVSSPITYILIILISSLLTACILALLKKRRLAI